MALIDPATWPTLLNKLDQPWTIAAYYGPEGAVVPMYGSPLPAGWTSRTFTMHVTPEPGTLALLLSGVGALAAVARRRRAPAA